MQLWGLHAIDLALVVDLPRRRPVARQARRRESRDARRLLPGGPEAREGLPVLPELRHRRPTPDQAVAVSREVYRQGIGGMWIQSLVLFLTPFYWFTVLLFRRVRLTTMGDYFAERFQSRFLARVLRGVHARPLGADRRRHRLCSSPAKTMVAMTPKAGRALHARRARRASLEFTELQPDRAREPPRRSPRTERTRWPTYCGRSSSAANCARSCRTSTRPGSIIGLRASSWAPTRCWEASSAAALTDAIQGTADRRLLGAAHTRRAVPHRRPRRPARRVVPAHMFELFGSASLSDHAWFTVDWPWSPPTWCRSSPSSSGMQTAGSATNEFTARIGMIGGMFAQADPDAVLGAGGPDRGRPVRRHTG